RVRRAGQRAPRRPGHLAGTRSRSVGSGERRPRWWAELSLSRRGGQQRLSLADEARCANGTEETKRTPELVIGLGPVAGLDEFLGSAKSRERGRPRSAHRVEQLGRPHEVLVDQRAGGIEPGRVL